MNYVSISGRIVRNIELKKTANGIPVCNFTVAVRRDYGDGADFINCVAWRKTAELISKWLKKGSMALFQGRLTQSSWESQERGSQYKLEITVDKVEFLESKAQEENEEENKKDNPFENEEQLEEQQADDNLPF